MRGQSRTTADPTDAVLFFTGSKDRITGEGAPVEEEGEEENENEMPGKGISQYKQTSKREILC